VIGADDDRALRRAAGLVHGLEERVRAARRTPRSESAESRQSRSLGGCARSWASGLSRLVAASERTRGTGARHAAGSAGEETATGRDRELRPGQCVSGEALSGGTQSALRACGNSSSRLSSAASDGAATGRGLLAGGRTSGQCGLGGALSRPAAATGTAKPALGAGQEPRAGAGKRSRRSRNSLSRSAGGLPRVEGFYSAGRDKGRCPFPRAPFPEITSQSSSAS
jgi:hypothetical protein